jgi:hypothetical protein
VATGAVSVTTIFLLGTGLLLNLWGSVGIVLQLLGAARSLLLNGFCKEIQLLLLLQGGRCYCCMEIVAITARRLFCYHWISGLSCCD